LRNDEISSGITTLTLNNPRRYNALSLGMLYDLQSQLDDIAKDEVSGEVA
jgi:enoyl-CoA hydratase/carnithine racemase